jgi:hypothetical protein
VTNYRRNFICGGRFFFTANLAERRLRLLVDTIVSAKDDGFRCPQPILRITPRDQTTPRLTSSFGMLIRANAAELMPLLGRFQLGVGKPEQQRGRSV